MRHGKSFNHLGRKTGHRRLMLANMASSLITHKRITTTLAKAKALRGYVEPLITKSKEDTTHSRRVVFSYLQDKEATAELFKEVGAKVADRPGGYTRIIKLAPRLGDNADLAMIELVDFNELLVKEKKEKKATRRRRGGAGAGTANKPAEAATPVAAPVAEEVAVKGTPVAEAEATATEETAPVAEAEAPAADEASADEASEEEKKD
ncbi:MAG: 50S ribosomal protein L17 [Flavobacteriales bacterium]|nr:50S ribosomal protein L17 [Flavobacteriales bacterium]